MGSVKSCCIKPMDDKLMVTKMDLSHCGCAEVPHVVFNAERCIETLILASNQISSLPPQLFHCQEMKHLNLNDNCLSNIPSAIGSFIHLVSLKLDKNNLQELPDNLKTCKKLKRLSLSNNPWKQVPNTVTQLISLEELYMNDCELNYLPASVGRLSKLKVMELRNNNLCNLPLSMTRLESLTRLDISDNEFTEFPSCIPKLRNLKELLLDNNDIEEIIDIKNLVNLEHLDASYNHIIKVSESIGCCVHLCMLNLSFNYIEQLPVSIGSITHLQTLQCEMNELTEVPKTIGKLSHLEELNLCNNKLCSLPSTMGLLRNLKNLNVSKNIIEEFPPEIGSCIKLGIINAAYNRLRVLPSEIGYLSNLKVLDLVGNFLMYLPITIINIRGVRAIWLSANQSVPLIPFTEDLNLASGERFLTNIALPQLGENPLIVTEIDVGDGKYANNEKTTWSKKISFAEDDDILPGKLHRTPTPFPKELRAPCRKHPKTEECKRNDNYVNIIDGKVSEQENLLLPNTLSLGCIEGNKSSDGGATQIKEANIRRNNRDLSLETMPQNQNDNCGMHYNSENCSVFSVETVDKLNSSESQNTKNPASLSSDSAIKENVVHGANKVTSSHICEEKDLITARQQVVYLNLKNDIVHMKNKNNETDLRECLSERDAHIREICLNEIIDGSSKTPEFLTSERHMISRNDYINGNKRSSNNYLLKNSAVLKEQNSLDNGCGQPYKSIHCGFHPIFSTEAHSNVSEISEISKVSTSTEFSVKKSQPLSKQDFISLAEQMKNKNISPPCYEIAKMYSTKASLFENNRMDKFNYN